MSRSIHHKYLWQTALEVLRELNRPAVYVSDNSLCHFILERHYGGPRDMPCRFLTYNLSRYPGDLVIRRGGYQWSRKRGKYYSHTALFFYRPEVAYQLGFISKSDPRLVNVPKIKNNKKKSNRSCKLCVIGKRKKSPAI